MQPATHKYERSKKMYHPRAMAAEGNSTYKYINVFSPLPWQEAPFLDTSDVILLTGSAGGGKSRVAAEKLHGYCLKYPGSVAVALRKTKQSIENTLLRNLKEDVIGKDPRVALIRNRNRFEYSNGSILSYAGMNDEDAREHLRSYNIDIAWMEEATQFEEADFNELNGRMRGTAAPWRQIILTTNPDGPLHWINVKLIIPGSCPVYRSAAQDNPNNPESYVKSLDRMTGEQRKRLVEGKWYQGSGAVFDTWEDDYNIATGESGGNVTLDAEYIPGGGDIVWAIDDGYSGEVDEKTGRFTGKSHPRAILIAQKRHDGQLAVFYESYAIERLATDHIREVLVECNRNNWPMPEYVVRDRAAASLAGSLRENGIHKVKYNTMNVDESTKEMRQWVSPDQNEFRRFIVHPRCEFFRFEMAQYSMDLVGRIVKEHDNGVDAARYLVWNEVFGVSQKIDIVTYSMVANNGT
jgi:phage terminase large subunit